MGIGVSIFLLAVGAILTFALDLHLGAINLDVVGWILMIAGALGLIVATIIWGNRGTTRVTTEPTEYREVVERPTDITPPLR